MTNCPPIASAINRHATASTRLSGHLSCSAKSSAEGSSSLSLCSTCGASYGFSSICFCPVGTPENSPAIHRWVTDPTSSRSPGGTNDNQLSINRFFNISVHSLLRLASLPSPLVVRTVFGGFPWLECRQKQSGEKSHNNDQHNNRPPPNPHTNRFCVTHHLRRLIRILVHHQPPPSSFVLRHCFVILISSFGLSHHTFLNTQMNNITTVTTVNTNSSTPDTHPASSLSTGAIGGRGGSWCSSSMFTYCISARSPPLPLSKSPPLFLPLA